MAIVGVESSNVDEKWRSLCQASFSQGGLGLRSAERGRHAAYWSSWADALPMVHKRHPDIADKIVHDLEDNNVGSDTICGLIQCAAEIRRTGFDAPSWSDLKDGKRPASMQSENRELGIFGYG